MDTLDEFYCATFAPITKALSDALRTAEFNANSYRGELARLNKGIARFLSLERPYYHSDNQLWQFRVMFDLNTVKNMVGEISHVEEEIIHRFRSLINKAIRGERTDTGRMEG